MMKLTVIACMAASVAAADCSSSRTDFWYILQTGDTCASVGSYFGVDADTVTNEDDGGQSCADSRKWATDRMQISRCAAHCDAAACKVTSGDSCTSIAKALGTTFDHVYVHDKGPSAKSMACDKDTRLSIGEWVEVKPGASPAPGPATPTPAPGDLYACSYMPPNEQGACVKDDSGFFSLADCQALPCGDQPVPPPAPAPSPGVQACDCIQCGSSTPWGVLTSGSCSPASGVCSATASGAGCYTDCASGCDCHTKTCASSAPVPPTAGQLWECDYSGGQGVCVQSANGYLAKGECSSALCNSASQLRALPFGPSASAAVSRRLRGAH